jgi:hypothetical protein
MAALSPRRDVFPDVRNGRRPSYVYGNLNQFFMAGLMTAPWCVIELIVMRGMYPMRGAMRGSVRSHHRRHSDVPPQQTTSGHCRRD